MKEEISGNIVEVRRKSNRVMAIVLTLGRKVMCIIRGVLEKYRDCMLCTNNTCNSDKSFVF